MGFLRKLIGSRGAAGEAGSPVPAGAAADDAFARGLRSMAAGRHAQALAEFDTAVGLAPAHADAWCRRGSVLAALGRPQDALASLGRALEARPDHPDAHFNRGAVLQSMARFEEAAACYAAAVALHPQDAHAWSAQGAALGQLRRFDQARQSLERALALRPDDAGALVNLAVVQGEMREFAAAVASLDRALALRPGTLEAWYNRGNMLGELGDWQAALASYDRALALDPGSATTRWNRGLCLLRLGDWERGWREYEWRWEAVAGMRRAAHPQPLWLGESPLAGRTILLHAEQGLGDTLQFCRFARQVHAMGARVWLEVQAPLRALLGGLAGVDRVFAQGEALPAFDVHCPLMSLPLALKTRPGSIPAAGGYLEADPRKVAAWAARVGAAPGLRVGVVWQGGSRPHQPITWAINERRNLPARHLAALALPGVSFFSLQKGAAAVRQWAEVRQSAAPAPEMADFTDELADFSDTAALICNLDLVITVDTAVAHLAGALGKPVWLLNRFDTCWRWLLGRADTPWYASMRVFRQARPGDWEGVMADVRTRLERAAGLARGAAREAGSAIPGLAGAMFHDAPPAAAGFPMRAAQPAESDRP